MPYSITEDTPLFRFQMADESRICHIRTEMDAANLPWSDPPDLLLGYMLNFQEIAKQYDAIEFHISENYALKYALPAWDCDSILVLNKDAVIPERSKTQGKGNVSIGNKARCLLQKTTPGPTTEKTFAIKTAGKILRAPEAVGKTRHAASGRGGDRQNRIDTSKKRNVSGVQDRIMPSEKTERE